MNTIIVKADNKMTKALVAIFEAFGLSFDVKKDGAKEGSLYDEEFVSKVLERSKSAKSGNTVPYSIIKKELFNL